MKKLRVALFIDGSGEPLAAEIIRGLRAVGIDCEPFLFSLSSLMASTDDFLDALKSLNLSHAFIVPHPGAQWNERSLDSFLISWEALNKMNLHVIQATIPLPLEKFSGMFEQAEDGLYRRLKTFNDYFINQSKKSLFQLADIDRLSSEYGRSQWHDSRIWEIAAIPASLEAIQEMGEYFTKMISSSQGDLIKLVIVDLDQILWPEILDEVGPEGILTSPSWKLFLNFQNYLLELKKRGILIAVLSSNQSETVIKAFDLCPKLLLNLKDFIHVELGWGNKVQGLLRISEITRTHPSNILFIDDSAINQQLIKKFIPEVKVLDATTDPIHNIDELNRKNFFEGNILTDVILSRTKSISPSKNELGQFFSERNPELEIKKASIDDVPRIVQLHQRTNQFNARIRRASVAEVKTSLPSTLVLSFRDNQNDYGLIGVVELKQTADYVIVFDWLLSCRVFSFSIEEAFIGWLRERRSLTSKIIIGEIIPQDRNNFIHELYLRLGFILAESGETQVWKDGKVNFEASKLKINDISGIP